MSVNTVGLMGACAHTIRDCAIKRQGYKDDATFANKISGSM